MRKYPIENDRTIFFYRYVRFQTYLTKTFRTMDKLLEFAHKNVGDSQPVRVHYADGEEVLNEEQIYELLRKRITKKENMDEG